MTMVPQTAAQDDLEVGDAVRLRELHDSVPAGSRGRVVGFYRLDPPQTLVEFDGGLAAVLDSALERVA
jgi:hypothetical protein